MDFIKAKAFFDADYKGDVGAPVFRRKFKLEKIGNAVLKVCGLGFGYYFINGKKVTDDLFTAPPSEYDRQCWYNVYDVSDLLNTGENIIAVILGNGFYDENFDSIWQTNSAKWRDNPKFALSLTINGKEILSTDEKFMCLDTSFVTRNELRSGETFDARLYDEKWKRLDFDDSKWHNAIVDIGFKPVLKECKCEPIRECEEYDFVSCHKTKIGYVLDFGVNMSGYVRILFDEKEGTEIKISHSEEVYDDFSLKLNGLNNFYSQVDFQVDKYICGKKPYVWSPKFTYHGFRYVLIEGLTKEPQKGNIKAIFVHQDVKRTSLFNCSDTLLNKIYDAGIRSTWSNMFYSLNDCPTREKFGWTNDAQASAEQIYLDFDCKSFFERWMDDFADEMAENGSLPSIVPSWGYGYVHGPVADGCFFEIPYRHYQYTGDKQMLIKYLPLFKKYYSFFVSDQNDNIYWLRDWNGHDSTTDIGKEFIKYFYVLKFCNIIELAENLSGVEIDKYYIAEKEKAFSFFDNCIDKDGRSKLFNQTAISILLYLNRYNNKILVDQLKNKIDEDNGHMNCGMLGLQYIYDALSDNGEAEYAYKIITANGEPGFSVWFDNGATTLWETWNNVGVTHSRNHHMYSNVLAWFFKYLLGVREERLKDGSSVIDLKPCFISELSYCKGALNINGGKINVEWSRSYNKIIYKVNISGPLNVRFADKTLEKGENILEIYK